MSAECLHCAAPGCSRNEPKIGRIIWKTASFTFQFQVRKRMQHLSHFSLFGAHHTREVQVHPSPRPCRSNSSHSAVPHSREIPAESMGWLRERGVPGQGKQQALPSGLLYQFPELSQWFTGTFLQPQDPGELLLCSVFVCLSCSTALFTPQASCSPFSSVITNPV